MYKKQDCDSTKMIINNKSYRFLPSSSSLSALHDFFKCRTKLKRICWGVWCSFSCFGQEDVIIKVMFQLFLTKKKIYWAHVNNCTHKIKIAEDILKITIYYQGKWILRVIRIDWNQSVSVKFMHNSNIPEVCSSQIKLL